MSAYHSKVYLIGGCKLLLLIARSRLQTPKVSLGFIVAVHYFLIVQIDFRMVAHGTHILIILAAASPQTIVAGYLGVLMPEVLIS